ncbi:MAG: type II toxin-antitoxin system prevent-host-death family antitoxin [Patescibacteria group bacterium]|nr:type II toxin-antitoxin system Phd/YefM family antitoxin [Patescibacteria group bacterium]MDP4031031.1 type II toxin-antitoxin system prevent-host-death family antitoxin [Candidatus Beckwithbacteria bacterium]MDZ4229135.1 type II toxin-antitoxin system prevent-host-death family antitoxin [Patescibacteria group bacterium]
MNTFNLTATELKRKTAEIINEVVFARREAIIERYGRPVARIVPVIKLEEITSKSAAMKKYFGSIKNFPAVSKLRLFKRQRLVL